MRLTAYPAMNKKSEYRLPVLCAMVQRAMIYACALAALSVLLLIMIYILTNGILHLSPGLFAWEYDSRNVSLVPAMINTVMITVLSLITAVPTGVCAAVYLTEYADRKSLLVRVVQTASDALAGTPSIVYGMFGSMFFVRYLGMGLSLVSGAFTLALMILPVIIRTAQEALIAVPQSIREGSLGLGAGKARTVTCAVLPAAVPGILSGIMLGTGRIAGESAALIFTAGTAAQTAARLSDSARTLAVHIYVLCGEGIHFGEAYASAAVLLVLSVVLNMSSGFISRKLEG